MRIDLGLVHGLSLELIIPYSIPELRPDHFEQQKLDQDSSYISLRNSIIWSYTGTHSFAFHTGNRHEPVCECCHFMPARHVNNIMNRIRLKQSPGRIHVKEFLLKIKPAPPPWKMWTITATYELYSRSRSSTIFRDSDDPGPTNLLLCVSICYSP